MSIIGGNHSGWEHARVSHVTGRQQSQRSSYATRNAAARYTKAAGASHPMSQTSSNRGGIDPRSYASPEYQNDISARRYEMASWLQDMGTLEDTTMADVAAEGANQATGWNQAVASEAEKVLTEQEQLEETEEEKEEKSQIWDPDQKAEDELAGLKAMLEALKTRKNNASQAVKKRLPYRYQRVSSAIRGAKNILQATTALTSATTSLAQVKRQAASGKYSEKEISIATTHARKMVRTARTKLRHLKAENMQENDGDRVKNDASQKMGIVVKKAHSQDKLVKQQKKDREMLKLAKKIQNMETKFRNKHRRKENWDLMEADMEYLRRQIEYLKNREDQEEVQNQIDTTTETQTIETPTADTNMFTSSEQSVILEQEAAVDAMQ
ncbi:MAG: hypothetical protein K2K70_03320 [Lachnospiraceae bacterium]|nr:hypothetical protein [Lachnospiraceae bacterium]